MSDRNEELRRQAIGKNAARRLAGEEALRRADEFAWQNGGYTIEGAGGRTEVFIPIRREGSGEKTDRGE
jgi:hypothetical protein